jgi:hypothetical protein
MARFVQQFEQSLGQCAFVFLYIIFREAQALLAGMATTQEGSHQGDLTMSEQGKGLVLDSQFAVAAQSIEKLSSAATYGPGQTSDGCPCQGGGPESHTPNHSVYS